jgi:hypothetical protein
MLTRFQDNATRVRHGKKRESQIANALRDQAGLSIMDASDSEDKERKIDRWLVNADGSRTAVQIKYRETGDDLLFEVFDKFYGFNAKYNKIGRDMIGDSKLYAVLTQDAQTIVMVPVAKAKKIVNDMLTVAEIVGWTVEEGESHKTLKYFKNGGRCELKVQRDPKDGRTKMLAYIPACVFTADQQAQVYKVHLPKEWQS